MDDDDVNQSPGWDKTKVTFELLDGPTNYRTWVQNMKPTLSETGHWLIVTGKLPKPDVLSEKEIQKAMEVYKDDILKKMEFNKIRQSQKKELSQWENANFKAAGFISRCCKPHIRQQLPEDITAQELWEYLKRYSPKGWAAKRHVIRRIEELEYKKTDTLAPFYSKLYELHAEAKTMGITFDDFILMKYLLNIDKNYSELISRTYDKAQDEKDPPSLQHIHERAIEEEAATSTRRR